MSQRITIHFRDGTKRQWPEPSAGVIGKGYRILYGDGVVTVVDQYENRQTFPMDLVKSVEEEPEPRW